MLIRILTDLDKCLNTSTHDEYKGIFGGLAATNELPLTQLVVLTTDNGYVKELATSFKNKSNFRKFFPIQIDFNNFFTDENKSMNVSTSLSSNT